MRRRLIFGSLVGLVVVLGVIAVARLWLATPTTAGSASSPIVAPAVTPAGATPSEPQSSWDLQYGIVALAAAIVGSVLTLLVTKLLEPVFEEWGKKLNERRKGEARRFREKYMLALGKRHGKLKLVGISGKESIAPPKLKEVYVSLRMGGTKGTEEAKTEEHSLTIDKALTSYERLLILGEPGAGKSTLLDYVTLLLCGEVDRQVPAGLEDKLPVFLRLRACVDNERPLHKLMADTDTLPLLLNPPDAFFDEQLDKGHCLVLLDGLDEVIDEKQRNKVAKRIDKLVRTFPDNRYVITCRTAGWKEGLLSDDFTRLYIRGFSNGDIQRFVTSWYRAVRIRRAQIQAGASGEEPTQLQAQAEQRATREAQALIDALQRTSRLYEIARNPLILSLIALVHYRRQKLPQGRAKLYQECLEILLYEWDTEDKELKVKGPSLKAKETLLQQIAYLFHSSGEAEMNGETLERLIGSLIPSLECPIGPMETLQQIEERSGILVARTIDQYVFAHLTLQEYLTATRIEADNEKKSELLKHLGDESWREVILLYVGMISNATELVKEILSQPDDAERNMLLLAAECLAEDVQVDSAVRQKVLDRLEETFRVADNPVLIKRLGEALVALGRQEVSHVFLRALDVENSGVRATATQGLGQLARQVEVPTAVGALMKRLQQDLDATVRRAAALGLTDLDRREDTILEALTSAQLDSDKGVRGATLWALLNLGQAEQLGYVQVSAGEFEMGSDEDDPAAYDAEKPKHRVYLDQYYIGQHLVTNKEFDKFVTETNYSTEAAWRRFATPGRENHPVVAVTWHDAQAYADWAGAHLPSEAEWEKAASWDNQRNMKRQWPWGNTFDRRLCNTEESPGKIRRLLPWLSRRMGKILTTPVGRFAPDGNSPCGATDMAGNVWEWCSTLFHNYPYNPDVAQDDADAKNPYILRGGSWWNGRNMARCAYRAWGRGVWHGARGFRVARRNPQE